MKVLSEEFLTTQDLMAYVQERHSRHWGKSNVYVAIMRKKLPVYHKIGRQNIYRKVDIDKYISSLKRSSSSGKSGVKYKARG